MNGETTLKVVPETNCYASIVLFGDEQQHHQGALDKGHSFHLFVSVFVDENVQVYGVLWTSLKVCK